MVAKMHTVQGTQPVPQSDKITREALRNTVHREYIFNLKECTVQMIGATNREARDKIPFTGPDCIVGNVSCNDLKHPSGYLLCKECQFRTRRRCKRFHSKLLQGAYTLQSIVQTDILFMADERLKL